jgi:uncharacterized protein YeeX (DUF496 family)
MRSYNYWSSVLVEKLALQSKAPVVGYAGQFEGFEDKWATSNVNNYAYLEVNPVTDNAGGVLPMPQRMPPPADLSAIVNAMMAASEDLKSVTGQYDASLGQKSNETSGRAIIARQREGDTGSYHYVDNMASAVRQAGKVLVDWIPKVYDTRRVLRILGEDGKPTYAGVDPEQATSTRQVKLGNVIETIYNLNLGKYDVSITVGPGFATKRQEQLTVMSEMTKANPALWQVIGDLLARAMDLPGSDKMADRLKLTLLPAIQQAEQAEGQGMPPEAQAQIAQAQQALQEQGQMIQEQGAQAQEATVKAVAEVQKAEIAKRDLEIARERLRSEERAILLSKQLLDARTGEQMAKLDANTQEAINDIQKMLDDYENRLVDSLAPKSSVQSGKEVEKENAEGDNRIVETLAGVTQSHEQILGTVNAMIAALTSQAAQSKRVVIQTPSGDTYTGQVN